MEEGDAVDISGFLRSHRQNRQGAVAGVQLPLEAIKHPPQHHSSLTVLPMQGTTRPFLAARIVSFHKNPTVISRKCRGMEWFATKATIHYVTPSLESVPSLCRPYPCVFRSIAQIADPGRWGAKGTLG